MEQMDFINFVITTDGKVTPTMPKNGTGFSLDELRAIVGGYIEIVYLDNGRYLMVLNEEGKLEGLPINEKATYLFHNHTTNKFDTIVGNVLVCESQFIK